MNDEKVLTPEEEKLIENISGTEEITEDELLEQPGNLHIEDNPTIIENASEVVPVAEMPKRDVLDMDMAKLAGMDAFMAGRREDMNYITREVAAFKANEGLDIMEEKIKTDLQDTKQKFDLLKKNIGERALAMFKKDKNKNPGLGVQIKISKSEELDVNEQEAIKWAVENGHIKLLSLDTGPYMDVLKTGVLDGQPGKVSEAETPKAFISLKPYQKLADG